jgi:ArsR family transcriptional regulator, arsenate/arsenite/antimonite-responsive transcriptional repressor / arsenate reductase (thioredoxin)
MAANAVAVDIEPPGVIRLLAHPVRWRLMRELARSDRTVRELTELVDEPQNLVSYHLRQLHDGELVVRHRSTADGRDVYYAIELDRCRHALHDSAVALHPGLGPVRTSSPSPSRAHCNVLFLCTGNSARSQMAEALLDRMSAGTVAVESAGSSPKPLHRNAVRAMRTRGIDISGHRTKHVDELGARHFDVVITLCDRVREVCPELPGHPERVHWSMADPAQDETTRRASYPAFERTAAELEARIGFLLHTLGTRYDEKEQTP